MVDIRTRKDLEDLKFYLWRIRDERRGEWRKEVYLMGDEHALETLIESLQGLQDSYYRYGSGTRKYKCNPPRDFDHVGYGRQHRVTIDWLDSLVVKTGPDVPDDEIYNLEGKVVTIRVNPTTLSQMITSARAQVDKSKRYGHGSAAIGGLWFSPDWLGIE
jgi:hypothetical protein